MRQELLIVLLAVAPPAFSADQNVVHAIVLGNSPAIEQQLNALPRIRHYEAISFRVGSGTKDQRLIVALSGGIETAELTSILRTIRLDSISRQFPSRWRLAVHGDSRYARVTIAYPNCRPRDVFITAKDGADWRLIAEPQILIHGCINIERGPDYSTRKYGDSSRTPLRI